jgi:hypothetical protein
MSINARENLSNMTTTTATHANALAIPALDAVNALDLDPIKLKLMHDESGKGWSQEHVDAVEKEYRRFLCLKKLYPDEVIVPAPDVEHFWRYHILDTLKYVADCEKLFGGFLHHDHQVSMRAADDAQFRREREARLRSLVEATFGTAGLIH